MSEWVKSSLVSMCVCDVCVWYALRKSTLTLHLIDWLGPVLDFHWNKADATVCLPAKWDFSGRCLLRPSFFFSLSTFLEYFIFLAVGKCSMAKKVVSGSFLPWCFYYFSERFHTLFSPSLLKLPHLPWLLFTINCRQPSSTITTANSVSICIG